MDWWVAREIDAFATELVQKELLEREIEKEKRDREFWQVMFGGEPDAEPESLEGSIQPQLTSTLPKSDDELIARSMLGRR